VKASAGRSRRIGCPFPQDPTACQAPPVGAGVPLPEGLYWPASLERRLNRCSTHELPRQNVCLH